MTHIREVFGFVDKENYPGQDFSKRIDNLIEKYSKKEEEFSEKLAEELYEELKKRGWENTMGVTYRVKNEKDQS